MGWDKWEVVDLYQGVGWGTRYGFYLIVVAFSCAFVFCCLMSSVILFLTD